MVSASDLVAPPRATVSQVTAVEQARAVAEVLAAVQVAQQCPRSIIRAQADMEAATARLALASRAFYSVPNRGSGPSVHLARELARIWGNIDYGVRELRRDDAAGESEIQAFAWDQQTNARTTRSFIVPHVRMKKVKGEQTREKLIDLGDIYLNNQNIGARAVRECIYAILPGDFVAEAEDRCRVTLEKGDGKALPERIADMLAAYKRMGVTQGQIEARLGRPSSQWQAQDVASLGVVYRSIDRAETTVAEEFPAAAPTAAALTAPTADRTIGVVAAPSGRVVEVVADEQPVPGEQKASGPQIGKINALMGQAGVEDRDARLAWTSEIVERTVTTSKDLTRREAHKVIDRVSAYLAAEGEDGESLDPAGEPHMDSAEAQ